MTDGVLIVDDSLTVRMDLAEAFEAAGFAVHSCASAEEARQTFAREKVAITVLDVVLPDGDGVDLLKEFRASPAGATVAILMLSTEAEVKDRVRGLQTGADEYVGKPYDTGYVVARARELVRSRRADASPPTAAGAILLIDDSVTFREEVRDALEHAGYAVAVAGTGEEGLRIASARPPSAVIVDGALPGIDGPTVIRHLRLDAALRSVPCVLLTGSLDRGAELRALDAGADAFVRKEEDVGVLLARLGAVLRHVTNAPALSTSSLLAPKKVLAVDDSPTYLEELGAAMRSEGYDVVLARSGEEALELLAVQPVDCILMDLVMPGLGGQEACARIKAAPIVRDIPLIMLTALENASAMIQGLSVGADDYITKSSDFDVVKARVRAQIRRKQFEDESRRIRDELLTKELEAQETQAARELAETRAALVRDLERKNEELDLARRQAERLSSFKSQFLANMSHELRTPLNAIIGFSELLTDEANGPLTEAQREFVNYVLDGGRHLLTLINDILDLSKIEAGRIELHHDTVDPHMLMDSAREIIRPFALKQGVTVTVREGDGVPRVAVDPVRIKQVLFNLLSNAVKFTPAGGTVTLDSSVGDGFWVVAVTDTGIGIRAQDLPRLFREFERIESPSGPKPEGTGLGLALTKRLIELHGGSITVTSTPGQGSTFTVRLPLQ